MAPSTWVGALNAAYAALLAALAVGGGWLLIAGLRGTTLPGTGLLGTGLLGTGLGGWWRTARRRTGGRRHVPAAAAVVAGFTAYAVTGIPAVALLAAAAVPVLPWLWHVGRNEERAIARMEALTDWTRRLKDQLSTGSGLVAAVVATAGTAPAAVAPAVQALAMRLQAGTDPEEALRRFAAHLADPVSDQVVAALLLHLRDRGPHLGEVLAAVAGDAARQVTMRREVHAKRTQPRHTVRFMMIFGMVVALVLVRGDLAAVYATPAGQVVLTVLAGAFLATLAWVRAMSQPAPQSRFLDGAA